MTDRRRPHQRADTIAGWCIMLLQVALAATVVVLAFTGCATPTLTADTTPVTSTVVVVPDLHIDTTGAVATAPADRVNPPTTTTDPTTAITDRYTALGLPCPWAAAKALNAGWPTDLIPKVLRTAFRETRCQYWLRSTTSDSGLMQINDIVLRDHRFQRDWPAFDPQTLFDPDVNLAVAWWLFQTDIAAGGTGWGPWRGGA